MLYKYKVVLFIEDRGPINMIVEASGVITLDDTIVFLDEHGEDGHVFRREDVIVYYTI
jgi:hypothetical protein